MPKQKTWKSKLQLLGYGLLVPDLAQVKDGRWCDGAYLGLA